MNTTRLISGAIAGAIVFFLLGWLIYGNVLEKYMYHNTGRAGHIIIRWQVDFLFVIIGNLLQGLLFSYILVKGNVTTPVGGLITGSIIGFLMILSTDTITYGTSFVLSLRGMMADVIAFTLISAIAGTVVAAVTGRGANVDQE